MSTKFPKAYELTAGQIVYRYHSNAVDACRIISVKIDFFSYTHSVDITFLSAMTGEVRHDTWSTDKPYNKGSLYLSLDRATGQLSHKISLCADTLWFDDLIALFHDSFVNTKIGTVINASNFCNHYLEVRRYLWKNNQCVEEGYLLGSFISCFMIDEKGHYVIERENDYKKRTTFATEEECRRANTIQIFDFEEEKPVQPEPKFKVGDEVYIAMYGTIEKTTITDMNYDKNIEAWVYDSDYYTEETERDLFLTPQEVVDALQKQINDGDVK